MLPGGASTFFRPNLRARARSPSSVYPHFEAMKSSHIRAKDTEERWYLYDASEHILGHLASEIAMRLMGKDRPQYTPSELGGAHVVVVNGGQVRMTGKKLETKEYQKYSGYPGGLYRHSLDRVRERRPQDIVKLAVRRMLPKTRLGKSMPSRLKVYAGEDHPHTAQQPSKVEALLR